MQFPHSRLFSLWFKNKSITVIFTCTSISLLVENFKGAFSYNNLVHLRVFKILGVLPYLNSRSQSYAFHNIFFLLGFELGVCLLQPQQKPRVVYAAGVLR